jgi:hypothetical protein
VWYRVTSFVSALLLIASFQTKPLVYWRSVETYCFIFLLVSAILALGAWIFGMVRPSFGALPAALWITLVAIQLACAAIIGVIEFSGAR